jgi:hypothetical protein
LTSNSLHGARDRHWYKIFGLLIRSEFELPEAKRTLEDLGAADIVDIRRGEAPRSLTAGRKIGDWVEASADECLYRLENIGRMLVSQGRTIVVEPNPGVPDSDLKPYILGSALGTIAHQRRLVPLHVSIVQTPMGNIAFTGPSGAGKSTIAAALEKFNGWRILCDDVAVFDPAVEVALLHTGVRSQKLWSDAIAELGLSQRPMSRDVSRHDKFQLALDGELDAQASPFRHLFQLCWGQNIAITELSAGNRFRLLMNAVYRPYVANLVGNVPLIHQAAVRLSQTVKAFELTRPKQLASLERVAQVISDHCALCATR